MGAVHSSRRIASGLVWPNYGGFLPIADSPSVLVEKFKRQQGKCGICGVEHEHVARSNNCLQAHHCHKTGQFIAWLCRPCNVHKSHFCSQPLDATIATC